MKKYIIVFFLFIICGLHAQKSNNQTFKEGDRICFIGNSITHDGRYHALFQLYNATRFPDEKVEYYNCGIAGDIADGMINRFEKDILIHKPTHAFLMTGMNDINRVLYFKGTPDADNLENRKKALDNYYTKTEILANMLIKNNIKPIFMTPSIYDQTAKIERFNDFGANDALALCAEHIRKLGKKYNVPVVDLHKVMSEINTKVQNNDPTFTIVGHDRIHPGDLGHLVMAFEIIKTIAPSEYVSKISLDARKRKVNESYNCDVKIEKAHNLMFKVLESSLPFLVKEKLSKKIDTFVPLQKDLNKQILAVNKLRKGNYKLLIDDIEIATFTSKELKKGVNLSHFQTTPQYKLAKEVHDLVFKYHKTQDSIRTLRLIEHRMLNKYEGANTLDSKKEFLYAENEKSKGKSWYEWDKKNIKKYFEILPKEKAIWKRLKETRDKIYNANKPEWHSYTLIKI